MILLQLIAFSWSKPRALWADALWVQTSCRLLTILTAHVRAKKIADAAFGENWYRDLG